jgi:hypothetical protein
MKSVLDEIKIATIECDLQKMIDSSNVTDLRAYLIRDFRMMSTCRSRFVHKYKDTYLLLNTSTTGGYHKEIKSYALYLKLIDLLGQPIENPTTQYMMQCGVDSTKMITKVNGFDVTIKYEDGMFVVVYKDVENRLPDDTSVITFLTQNNILTLL